MKKKNKNENELLVPKSISEGFSNRPKRPQFVFPASGRGGDIIIGIMGGTTIADGKSWSGIICVFPARGL